MSTKQARAIVDKIQRGNYEASVALIKTFGLIAPGKWPRKSTRFTIKDYIILRGMSGRYLKMRVVLIQLK
jgi:hypothetical protein